MKLEDQVVDLKLSKQLKKAGYKQKGLWWWVWIAEQIKWELCQKFYNKSFYTKDEEYLIKNRFVYYVAPTVAELGKRLPRGYESGKALSHKVYCAYSELKEEKITHTEYADTEANARAKMWLYLKKEDLL